MKSKSNIPAFNFFMVAKEQDIVDLGWRIGEKLDSINPWEEIIIPLCKGIIEGSTTPPDELKKFIQSSTGVYDKEI